MRQRLTDILCGVLLSLTGLLAASAYVQVTTDVTPPEARFGWQAEAVAQDAFAERTPVFALSGESESTEDAVVKLWDYARAINGGAHFPTYRQAIGDCVANGLANALNYGQAADIYFGRVPSTTFRPVDRPWLYGVSRMDEAIGNGRLGNSDGSIGHWAVKAAQLRGVLAADEPGVPEYSGSRAREWGTKGVPPVYYFAAAMHTLGTYAQVRTDKDVEAAICNEYPVTIASNVGFQMRAVVHEGKHWGRPSGTWHHQMALIGWDSNAVSPFTGEKGAAYCINSWGPDAHGPPADDAPPGGFWIDRATINRIVKQGDSWACSGFTGFPARPKPDDFVVFDAGVDVDFDSEDPVCVMAASQVVGLNRAEACDCAVAGGCASLLLGGHCLRRRLRRRTRRTLSTSA